MSPSEELRQLRQRRNYFAAAAVLLLFAAMGVSLPRALARRNQLKKLNGELLGLQSTIVAVQQRTREVQAEILKTQGEIREVSNPH